MMELLVNRLEMLYQKHVIFIQENHGSKMSLKIRCRVIIVVVSLEDNSFIMPVINGQSHVVLMTSVVLPVVLSVVLPASLAGALL